MTNTKNITVIIPIFNEVEQIPLLVNEIRSFSDENKQIAHFQFIFVDDGSRDNSFEKLRECCGILEDCKVVTLSRNYGSHAAIRAGSKYADGEYVTIVPADLQIPLNDVLKMKGILDAGNDIAWVVRDAPDIGKFEKLFSSFYSALMKKYVNPNFPSEGIETLMMNRKVLEIFNENVEGNSSFALQILSYGFKFEYLKLKKHARKVGKSKWTLSKKIKLMIDSFVGFSFAPIRLVTIIGVSLFFVGLMMIIYILGRKLILNDLAVGWPMLISVLIFGFGVTNISLGIIAEYLWRTLDASRKRPVFIINEIVEFNAKDI